MSAPVPTRQAIDAAEPLTFPDRKAKQDLLITVKCRVDGFDCELSFSGAADQLLNITRRLREIGAEPVSAPVTAPAATNGAASPAKGKAKRVEPDYLSDGTAVCPVHGKELQPGRFGPYCPAKAAPGDAQNDKGFCALKFAE